MNKLCENGDQGGIIVNPPVSIFKKKYLVALIAASMPAMAMAQTTPSAGWNNKGEYVVTDSENLTGSIYFGGGSTLRVEGGLIQDFDFSEPQDTAENNALKVSGGRAAQGSINGKDSTVEITGGEVEEILVFGDGSGVTVDDGSLNKIYMGGSPSTGAGELSFTINGGEASTVLIDNDGRGGKGESRVEVNGGVLRDLYKGVKSGTLEASGGALEGNIEMGMASDVVYLNADTDLSKLEVLDGEGGVICGIDGNTGECASPLPSAPSFAPMSSSIINATANDGRVITISSLGQDYKFLLNDEDPTDSSKGYEKTDKLYLNTDLTGSSVSIGKAGDTRIIHWDEVHIGQSGAGRLNLTGDLNSGWDDKRVGSMTIASDSVLALNEGTSAATVRYNVVSSGTIDLREGASDPSGVLTIEGDYTGKSGSELLVKTTWNDPDVQQNDLLVITGDAQGDTQVSVPGGIIGDVTIKEGEKSGNWESPVVTVKGGDNGETDKKLTFHGVAGTQNAGEAQLTKKGDSYYWTLAARQPGEDPDTPTKTPIYTPPVSGYVQTPRIIREMGFAQLGQLHERVGEQQTWVWDECGYPCEDYRNRAEAGERPYPVWGRLHLGNLKEQGKDRLGYNSKNGFLQLGVDLNVDTDEELNHRHTGVMVTYGYAKNDFYDKYRAEDGIVSDDKYTGRSKTHMFSLGAYNTWYKENGTYLDLVGNVSWLRNKYHSRNGVDAKQNGYGIGVSAEVGRPWKLGNSHWHIEPQAQLSYQYVKLNSFNDGHRRIHGQKGGALRGRIGARLAWNNDNGNLHTNTFYVLANVLHDFTGYKTKATVGNDRVTERFARTWGELGIGAQTALGKSTYLYADVRYERALGGYSNQVYRGNSRSREGYTGNIGLRFTW